MTSRRMSLSGAALLESTDERLIVNIAVRPRGRWLVSGALVIACITSIVVLMRGARPTSIYGLAALQAVGAACVVSPWFFIRRIALDASRLAPVSGRLELRRVGFDEFRVAGGAGLEERSSTRGLFHVDCFGIETLVLVIGLRLITLAVDFRPLSLSRGRRDFLAWRRSQVELSRWKPLVGARFPPHWLNTLVGATMKVLGSDSKVPIPNVQYTKPAETRPIIRWAVALCVGELVGTWSLAAHFISCGLVGSLVVGTLLGALLALPQLWALRWHVNNDWVRFIDLSSEQLFALCEPRPLKRV
jgi:hypothetical protein